METDRISALYTWTVVWRQRQRPPLLSLRLLPTASAAVGVTDALQ